MTKPPCIITEIRDDSQTEINALVAEVTGKTHIPKSVYYHNRATGGKLSYIIGAIAWPGKVREEGDTLPGFAVILTVKKDHPEGEEPTFRVAEEIEEQSVEVLLSRCLELRYKYGFPDCKDILRGWYGDPEQFRPVIYAINASLEKKKEGVFYIQGMPDMMHPNNFDFFARRIQSVLTPDARTGSKRLYLGGCDKLRNRIQNPILGSIAIKALGYAVHALLFLRPWEEPVNSKPEFYLKRQPARG